jgi:fumarate reductase subunit C
MSTMPAAKPPTTKSAPHYTEFHPRWYRPKVSVYWWLGERHYFKFIVRELSSVFVAVFVVETLLLINALRNGPDAYAHFLQTMQNPLVVILNIISLFFVVFHTITWFNLAPSATPVRVGGKRLPDVMIAGPAYVAWIVISAFIAWMVLR